MSGVWATLANLPTPVWVAAGVVLLPVLIVFGAVAIKLAWGFWPAPIAILGSAYAVYRLGIDWFWLAAVGIAAGLILTWLWQRTRLFLAGDRLLEKGMLLGD